MAYDAFISYSHAADGRLAPALQHGLQRLARPWHRPRALHVFRDDANLAVNPHLWESIREALDESEHFVLLASPEAAASPWVNREVEHWVTNKPVDLVLPVLTDGDLVWDHKRGDYDSARSSALPPALAGRFPAEPRHLDLRWARDEIQLDLRHARFRDAVADLAAPMHHLPKDEIESEDVRQHRRTVRLTRVAAVVLVGLLVAAIGGGVLAVRNARRARTQATALLARQLAASSATAMKDGHPDLSMLLAIEANRVRSDPLSRDSLLRAIETQPTLRTTLHGLSEPATAVAFDAAGTLMAASDTSGIVVVWDVAKGRPLAHQPVLARRQGTITALVFSSDGSTLASADRGGMIVVSDLATGRTMRTFVVHDTSANFDYGPGRLEPAPTVSGLAVSSHGELVAGSTRTGDVGIWSVATGARLSSVSAGTGTGTIAFSPDAKSLFLDQSVGGSSNVGGPTLGQVVAQRFDVTTGAAIGPSLQSSTCSCSVTILHFDPSPDGKQLTAIAGGSDRLLVRWDLTTGAQTDESERFTAARGDRVVDASLDGRVVVTRNDGDGTVRLRDAASGSALGPALPLPYLSTTPVALDAGSSVFAVGGSDGKVRLYSTHSEESDPPLGRRLVTQVPSGTDLRLAPDGQSLAMLRVSGAPTLSIIDARNGRPIPQAPEGSTALLSKAGRIRRPSFSPNARLLAVGGDSGLVFLNLSSGQTGFVPYSNCSIGPQEAVFAGDNRTGALGCFNPGLSTITDSVDVFDVATRSVRVPWTFAASSDLTALAFDPRGRILAIGFGDGSVKVGDASTGKPLPRQPRSQAVPVEVLRYSPDGRMLAAGLGDGEVIAWNAATGGKRALMPGSGASITALAFSPDGRTLAAGDTRGGVQLFDLNATTPVGLPLAGHAAAVTSLSFPRPGRLMSAASATTGPSGDVIEWHLGLDSWVAQACRVANRNLSAQEWKQYLGPGAPHYRRTCSPGSAGRSSPPAASPILSFPTVPTTTGGVNATTTTPSTTGTIDRASTLRLADSYVRNAGYLPVQEAPFDGTSRLNVVIGQNPDAASGVFRAFFFLGATPVGGFPDNEGAAIRGLGLADVSSRTVTVSFPIYRPNDIGCCPTGGTAKVRFTWNGSKIVALDPIPPH